MLDISSQQSKLQSERERLAELRWESSPLGGQLKETCNSPRTTAGSTSISRS
jgi:hypothetical protein